MRGLPSLFALAALFALAPAPLAGAVPARQDSVYRGSARELSVPIPRLEEAEVRIDGDASDPAWAAAAKLTDFTQFEPAEGIAATERTEARVFHTPSALYVTVRAWTRNPAALRATLADRDGIGRDDHVLLALDTFRDRRRAFILAANPLGIQQDGVLNESGGGGGGGGGDGVDLSPDFIWESRGRLTGDGYEVEIRIPFKSLKYSAAEVQSWGFQVIRVIGATGAEESWAPISRSVSSKLAQSGTLTGIGGLRPGRLLEINPVITGRRDGYTEAGEFRRESFEPDFGTNLKFGVTPNLTLDATYNPDFSQVEADAGQITTNERFEISYDEKRPFFLEGADLFETPERLVYTRTIIDPIAGAKLTGKAGGVSIAYLGAVDESPLQGLDRGWAPDPGRALFNIARLQRDVGRGSVLGGLVTDRESGGEFNRLAAVDGRVYLTDITNVEFQLANAWTRRWAPDPDGDGVFETEGGPVAVGRSTDAAHMFRAAVDRTGRNWGYRAQVKDIPEDFEARSGFLNRTGVTDFFGALRGTRYGAPGSWLESWVTRVVANRIWDDRDFWDGGSAAESEVRLTTDVSMRGNTSVEVGFTRGFVVLDPGRYARYAVPGPDGRPVTGAELIAPGATMNGLDRATFEIRSSRLKTISWSLNGGIGETPIFAEGTRGRAWEVEAEVEARPTDALRLEAELQYERIRRARDGSRYSAAWVPRLKAEYQVSRAIFVRALGQYSTEEVDLLRTPGGDFYEDDFGSPFRVRGGDRLGPDRPQLNPLQMDLLFSYQPSPGTVVFLGYGREIEDRGAYQIRSLAPRSDGIFVKVSYLWRN